MADKKSKTVDRLYVAPELRERWANIEEDDYPMLMAEYTRQMRDYAKQTNDAVKSTSNWMTLFGVLAILAIIVSILNFILSF